MGITAAEFEAFCRRYGLPLSGCARRGAVALGIHQFTGASKPAPGAL